MQTVGEELTRAEKAELGLSTEEADPGHTGPTVGEDIEGEQRQTANVPYHLTGPNPIDPTDAEHGHHLAEQARVTGIASGQRMRTSTQARNAAVALKQEDSVNLDTVRHDVTEDEMPEAKVNEDVEWESQDGPTEEEVDDETVDDADEDAEDNDSEDPEDDDEDDS